MRRITLLLVVVCATISLYAQNYVTDAFFETRGGFHNQIDDNSKYSNHFTGEFFNFQMFGNITDNISYRVRQRLNTNPFANDNILNATDYLYFDWKINDKWSLVVGKQVIYIGGFEYDYAPIDVYYWSDYCNQLPQGYAMGASLGYTFKENNIIYLQAINSPFSLGDNDNLLAYNLIWFGDLFSWWKTIWSANYVEAVNDKGLFYIALGNKFEMGDFYLEADYTEQINTTQKENKYSFSLAGKLDYNYRDKLDIFVKGGYDDNSINYVNTLNNPFVYRDPYKYVGGGVEYYPLDSKDLRLHCVYYYNNEDKIHNLDLGATWKLSVKTPNKPISKIF